MGFQYQQSQQVRPMHMNNLLESIGYFSVANINQWMMSIVTILWHGCRHLRHFNTGKRQWRSCSAVFCPALWCTKVLCCLDDPHRGASIIWTACNAGTLSWSGGQPPPDRSHGRKVGRNPGNQWRIIWSSQLSMLTIMIRRLVLVDADCAGALWIVIIRQMWILLRRKSSDWVLDDSSEVHLGLSCILAQPHGSPTIAFHSGQYPLSVCQHGSRCIQSTDDGDAPIPNLMLILLLMWWCRRWWLLSISVAK